MIMAKGSLMLQIEVEQIFSGPVTSLPEVWTVAIEYLDGGGRTVVREIATEKSQAMYLWATSSGYEAGQFALSDNALSDLWVVFGDRRPPKILHAPSHVPSPAMDDAVLVLLRVRDYGFSVGSPGVFSTVRRVSSHAYVDETALP
jgi:hypothetical protein